MPVKRRNHGRNKKNRGHVKPIPCINCGRLVPKDKAVKRYMIKEIVDASSKRDLYQALDNQDYQIPKLRIKYQYCISCAIHSRIVRVRSSEDRRIREPPVRQQTKQETKKQ